MQFPCFCTFQARRSAIEVPENADTRFRRAQHQRPASQVIYRPSPSPGVIDPCRALLKFNVTLQGVGTKVRMNNVRVPKVLKKKLVCQKIVRDKVRTV